MRYASWNKNESTVNLTWEKKERLDQPERGRFSFIFLLIWSSPNGVRCHVVSFLKQSECFGLPFRWAGMCRPTRACKRCLSFLPRIIFDIADISWKSLEWRRCAALYLLQDPFSNMSREKYFQEQDKIVEIFILKNNNKKKGKREKKRTCK